MTLRQRMQAIVCNLIQRLPPEPPQTLLELIVVVAHAEGVGITPYSCEPDGERCSGFVRREGLKSYGLYWDTTAPMAVQVLTVGHELGHIIQRHVPINGTTKVARKDIDSDPEQEAEAIGEGLSAYFLYGSYPMDGEIDDRKAGYRYNEYIRGLLW
jgi:hypothetical protein